MALGLILSLGVDSIMLWIKSHKSLSEDKSYLSIFCRLVLNIFFVPRIYSVDLMIIRGFLSGHPIWP